MLNTGKKYSVINKCNPNSCNWILVFNSEANKIMRRVHEHYCHFILRKQLVCAKISVLTNTVRSWTFWGLASAVLITSIMLVSLVYKDCQQLQRKFKQAQQVIVWWLQGTPKSKPAGLCHFRFSYFIFIYRKMLFLLNIFETKYSFLVFVLFWSYNAM